MSMITLPDTIEVHTCGPDDFLNLYDFTRKFRASVRSNKAKASFYIAVDTTESKKPSVIFAMSQSDQGVEEGSKLKTQINNMFDDEKNCQDFKNLLTNSFFNTARSKKLNDPAWSICQRSGLFFADRLSRKSGESSPAPSGLAYTFSLVTPLQMHQILTDPKVASLQDARPRIKPRKSRCERLTGDSPHVKDYGAVESLECPSDMKLDFTGSTIYDAHPASETNLNQASDGGGGASNMTGRDVPSVGHETAAEKEGGDGPDSAFSEDADSGSDADGESIEDDPFPVLTLKDWTARFRPEE